MTASLGFFGLSVIVAVVSVILDILDDDYIPNLAQLEIAQVSQDLERIAIFLDIYRLIILVVALKSKENEIVSRIKLCKRILIVWLMFFACLMGYRYYELYDDEEE